MQEAQEALNQLSICRVESSVCWEVCTLCLKEHSTHSYSALALVDTPSSQTVTVLHVYPTLLAITRPARGHLAGVSLETKQGPKEAAGKIRVVLASLVVTKWKFLLL